MFLFMLESTSIKLNRKIKEVRLLQTLLADVKSEKKNKQIRRIS